MPVNGDRDLRVPLRTKSLIHNLHLTLEEMFDGTTRKLAINKDVACSMCQRRRWENKHYRCRNCGGRKTVPAKSLLNVTIKRGSRDGQKIIFVNEGTQKRNRLPGDVIVMLQAIEHETFTREGDDLIMTMHLDLVESLCGFKKQITTLDKRQLSITSPQGKVVKDDDVKYLVGEGMPKFKNPNERGNLIIQFQVDLPHEIRSVHKKTIELCLPPRPRVEIPMEAIECNMREMVISDEDYDDDSHDSYHQNEEEYGDEQNYYQDYEGHASYDQNSQQQNYYEQNAHDPSESGMHQHGPNEQRFEQQYYHYYQDENSYEVQGNYERPREYDQHYNRNQQGYDSHYQHNGV